MGSKEFLCAGLLGLVTIQFVKQSFKILFWRKKAMRLFIISSVILAAITCISTGPTFGQDTAAEIATLQRQIERLQNVMNLGVDEIDRVGGQGAQGFAQQIQNWRNQLSNIDTQIARMDEQIANAAEQQRAGLTSALNNLLRQKAGAEAHLVQLGIQYESELSKLNQEKSQFTGTYNRNIENLNKQLDNLIKVNCCINGTCSQKSRAECVESGGTAVADCAQECLKIYCCKDGVVTETTKAQCASSGGREVNYPSYECEVYKCKTTSGECVDLTRGECEKNGGTPGTKTDCR